MLHGAQNNLCLGRITRDVVARLQAEPCAHGREVGVARRPGLVTGRPEIRRVGRFGRHPDGMGDRTRQHLVIAEQTRQYWQAGGIRRCPPGRTELVRAEVPDGPRARCRSSRAVPRVIELIEGAGGRVDHQRVAVARGARAALDGRGGAERIGARVALTCVVEGEGYLGSQWRHDRVGDAVGYRGVPRRAEVRVEVGGGTAHTGEPRGAVGVDRQARDVGVPDVVGGEHLTVGRSGDRGSCGRRSDGRDRREPGTHHHRRNRDGDPRCPPLAHGRHPESNVVHGNASRPYLRAPGRRRAERSRCDGRSRGRQQLDLGKAPVSALVVRRIQRRQLPAEAGSSKCRSDLSTYPTKKASLCSR